jgi:nucleotide-binding universal stress UspA family protein
VKEEAMVSGRFVSVLCPVDFSDFSARALRRALEIAAPGAEVVALNVVPLDVPWSADGAYFPASLPSSRARVSQARADLESFVRARTSRKVTCLAVEGDASQQIIEQACEHGSDLVVMGTHGLSGFERLLLGSVTEKVLRRAPCPVLSVCHEREESEHPLARILCPVSLERPAANLQVAAALALEHDAELLLLHVVDALPDPELMRLRIPFDEGDYRSEAAQASRARLEEMTRGIDSGGPVERLVAFGDPYRQIVEKAAEWKADAIVIGVHNRSPLDLLFFGSTTNHVVRMADCPVLTVRDEYRRPARQEVA